MHDIRSRDRSTYPFMREPGAVATSESAGLRDVPLSRPPLVTLSGLESYETDEPDEPVEPVLGLRPSRLGVEEDEVMK